MTKKELEKYEEMQDTFLRRCKKICDILKPLDSAFEFVYKFEINGNLIECECNGYWFYGGEEKHYAKFPKEYLYMEDEEIQKIVDSELKYHYI
jgi:hypothetical protein